MLASSSLESNEKQEQMNRKWNINMFYNMEPHIKMLNS